MFGLSGIIFCNILSITCWEKHKQHIDMFQNIRVDLVELGFKMILCELLFIFNTSGIYLYVLFRDCLE